MEGRGADEAHERYLIEHMTEAERLAGCLREVEKLAEKWHLTADRRKALRDALENHGLTDTKNVVEALQRAQSAGDEWRPSEPAPVPPPCTHAMTVWEVYTVTEASPSPAAVVVVERLHSTWDTFDDAVRQAGRMLGHSVRIRERFESNG